MTRALGKMISAQAQKLYTLYFVLTIFCKGKHFKPKIHLLAFMKFQFYPQASSVNQASDVKFKFFFFVPGIWFCQKQECGVYLMCNSKVTNKSNFFSFAYIFTGIFYSVVNISIYIICSLLRGFFNCLCL